MKKLLTKLCLTATLFAAPWASAETDTFGLGSGRNGALRVDHPTPINHYAQVTAPVKAGNRTLRVDSLSGFEPGALIMVLQSTGMAQELNSGWEAPLELQTDAAGTFELARVQSASDGVLTLTEPLVNAYEALATQVVRVPEYTHVEVSASGALQAQPWDGRTGGVLAFLATGTITNHGRIEAAGMGFQGGDTSKDGDDTRKCSDLNETSPRGAKKGEGVASPSLSGTGRGNAANAGGGGVCLMSGGGGGGHGGAGAQGGNSSDELDGARSVGGQGGVPLKYSAEKRLVFGGGGGAGHVGIASVRTHSGDGDSPGQGHDEHGNGNGYGHCKGRGQGHDEEECKLTVGTGESAGRGGGILFMRANQLSGTGVVSADGARGGDGMLSGGSGGGAGGIIHARFTGPAACGAMSAQGGAGGNSGSASVRSGPGGGGGGGVIFFRATSSSCPLSVTRGSTGTIPGAGESSHHGAGQAQNGLIDALIEEPPPAEPPPSEPPPSEPPPSEPPPSEPPPSEPPLPEPLPAEWTSHFEGSGCSATGNAAPMFSLLLLVMTLISARKR